MAMPTRPFTRVDVSSSTMPIKGGLVNVLDKAGRVFDRPVEQVASGIVAVPDAICGYPGIAPGLCEVDDSITVDAEKTPNEPENQYGPVFVAYRAVECMPNALDYESLATKGLVKNETYAVEMASQEALYISDDYFSSAPADLGSGSVSEGLGLMEQWLGGIGGGLIHVTRFGAQYLIADGKVKDYDDFLLYTRQGTPVVNGAGYANVTPDGVAALADTFWMWATPWMTLHRSPVIYSSGYGLGTNKETGIAERAYSIATDCDARAAFLVSVV